MGQLNKTVNTPCGYILLSIYTLIGCACKHVVSSGCSKQVAFHAREYVLAICVNRKNCDMS